MNKKELIQRWKDPFFVEQASPLILDVFTEGKDVLNKDLRGLVVGDKSPLELYYVGLYKKKIDSTDFSFSTFECAFSESIISKSQFVECSFSGVSFMSSKIHECNFYNSKFVGGSFNDAEISSVNFEGCIIKDKRSLPMSFLRVKFSNCDFSNSIFRNAEFRAAKFCNCIFSGARFEDCDFRGAKFEGDMPNHLGTYMDTSPRSS